MIEVNIEAAIIDHLNKCGLNAFADVPKPRPTEFVTVERTGGTSDYNRIDRPTVAIQSWSTSRFAASELALRVDACMDSITENAGITKCKRNSMYNNPDDSQARYQAVYDLVSYL